MVQTGSKSLLFPDVPRIENLQQVEDYLRRIMDILEELNRRRYEGLISLLAQAGGPPYLGKVITDSEVGWYNCTIYKAKIIDIDEEEDIWEEYGTGKVLNMICWVRGANILLEDNKIFCWPLGGAKTSGGYWVGAELFGRATIGICEL